MSALPLICDKYFSGRRFCILSHHTHLRPKRRTNPHNRTNNIPLLSIHPSQLPNMPKGGTKRNDHHCPQRSHGNCRWVNRPIRHCATHTEMCTKHGLPHQTYQPCTKCDGEEAAAEREFRNQMVSKNSPGSCQNQEDQDKKSKGKKGQGKNKK
jgi:hypothetical protein